MWEILLWKYGVPILISVLRKTGAIDKAEALGAKAVVWAENNIKTYDEYPTGKNGQSDGTGTP